MACDDLTLASTSIELALATSSPELTLTGAVPELTLACDECALTLAVETSLTFSVVPETLALESSPIELCFTTPVPMSTGEANDGANVGSGERVYEGKSGVVLEFRTLKSLTPELDITENIGDREVQFDHRDGFAANCSSSDAIGNAVYISGLTSGVLNVAQCDIDDPTKMPVRGIIETKPTDTTCFVRVSGLLTGLGSLSAGQTVFAANGGISHNVPAVTGEIVQALGVAVAADAVYLDISSQLTRRA